MKLKDARESYDYFTKTLSAINRQLAFAGIAVVWVFRIGEAGDLLFSPLLLWPLGFFVLSLFFDLLHYIAAAAIWGIYQHWKSKRVSEETDFEAPDYVNWAALSCFWLKIASCLVAYLFLGSHLARYLF